MENIQLTESELEMIRLKREQEELKAKEDELKKQIKRQKDIDYQLKKIDEFKASNVRKYEETIIYLNELNKFHKEPKYELVTRELTKNFQAYDYISMDEKDVYFNEDVKYNSHHIQRIGTKITIDIESASRKKGYSTEYYWALRYDYKNYKSAKTVDDKINEKLAIIEEEKKQKQAQLSAQETVEAELKQKYPEAIIEHHSEWVRISHYRNGGYSQNYFKVMFNNGLMLKCCYYNDGRYNSEVKYLNNVMSQEELIELVKNLPAKDRM